MRGASVELKRSRLFPISQYQGFPERRAKTGQHPIDNPPHPDGKSHDSCERQSHESKAHRILARFGQAQGTLQAVSRCRAKTGQKQRLAQANQAKYSGRHLVNPVVLREKALRDNPCRQFALDFIDRNSIPSFNFRNAFADRRYELDFLSEGMKRNILRQPLEQVLYDFFGAHCCKLGFAR